MNLPSGTNVTFQGLVHDPRSRISQPFSVTNAVVLKIR